MPFFFKYLPESVLTKKNDTNTIPFSQNLFWDTPIEKVHSIKHKNYIIERVLSHGLLSDFYFLFQMYTPEEIKGAVLKSKVLDKKTVNFCSIYFKIPLKDLYASSYYS